MPIKPLTFRTSLFKPGNGRAMTPAELQASERGMLWAGWFLAKLNQLARQNDPGLPTLYNSGVRYHHRWQWENWPDWRQAMADGELCCKAAVAERLAELWQAGIDARPFLSKSVIPDGPHKGLTMYHYRVWRPLDSLSVDPPPFLDTPWGPSVVEGPPDDHGQAGVIECPSIIMGLHWEAAFATTNRRPASPEFLARLTQILGHPPRTWRSGQNALPAAAGGASVAECDRALDQFLTQQEIRIPDSWGPLIRARNPVALALYRRLCERASKGEPSAVMAVQMVPALDRANMAASRYAAPQRV